MLKSTILAAVVLALCADASAQPIIVDHTTLVPIDQVPSAYLDAARAIAAMTIGRSVGWNIDAGLDCLRTPYASASSACKRGVPASMQWTGSYSRTNVTTFGWPGVGLPNPVPAPCASLSNGYWVGYQPQFLCLAQERQADYGVFSFQYDYISNMQPSNPLANYFTNGQSAAFTAWAQGLPLGKRAVAWTANLMRDDGTGDTILARLNAFSAQMRQWAPALDYPLLDMADLESHDLNGIECRSPRGDLALCAAYTDETIGGHLNATGQARIATAYWNILARLAGWSGPASGPDTAPPSVTLACTLAGCSAAVSDAGGVAHVTATVSATDAAGNTATQTATVP